MMMTAKFGPLQFIQVFLAEKKVELTRLTSILSSDSDSIYCNPHILSAMRQISNRVRRIPQYMKYIICRI